MNTLTHNNTFKNLFKKNKESFFLLTISFILPFIISSIIISFIIKYEDALIKFNSIEWIIFYLIAALFMAFAFTHTTFIALLSGFFLGWGGVIYVVPSYLLASIIGYALAKNLDKGNFMKTITEMPKAKLIAEELKNNELKIIILSRLSPILPFAMMNLVLSFLKTDFKKYLVGGFAGMLPRTLLFIWAGSKARDLREAIKKSTENDLMTIFVSILLILSLFGLFYYILRATKKAKILS